eukprot:1863403-Amphidinium_carterae.1
MCIRDRQCKPNVTKHETAKGYEASRKHRPDVSTTLSLGQKVDWGLVASQLSCDCGKNSHERPKRFKHNQLKFKIEPFPRI